MTYLSGSLAQSDLLECRHSGVNNVQNGCKRRPDIDNVLYCGMYTSMCAGNCRNVLLMAMLFILSIN